MISTRNHLLRRCTALALMVMLVGGHVAGLQLVAWCSMFVARVASAPTVCSAVVSTLDGSAPCALCRVVVAMRAHDEPTPAQPAPAMVIKVLAVLASDDPPDAAPGVRRRPSLVKDAFPLPGHRPDVEPPPPRRG